MKLKHWIFLGFVAIGGLYLAHVYFQHGGVSGFRSGLGLGA